MTRLTDIYRRQKRRWLQRLTGIHSIHHPKYSFGLTVPLTEWVFFPAYAYKDYTTEPPTVKIQPAHWKQCPKDSYHDCTATGRY